MVERPRKIPRTMPEDHEEAEHNDGESETTCKDDNFPTEAGNNVNVEEAHRGEESWEDDTLPTMTAIAAGGQSSDAELQMLQKATDAIVSKEGNISVSLILKRVTILLKDVKPGEDGGKTTWYPEPHFSFLKVKDESSEVINGTFRSMKCLRTADAGTFSQEMCSAFKAIPNLPSFKKRLLLRSRSSNDEGERILDKI